MMLKDAPLKDGPLKDDAKGWSNEEDGIMFCNEYVHMHGLTNTITDRHTDTDMQSDRQTHTPTHRYTDRQPCTPHNTHTQSCIHTHTHTQTHLYTYKDTHTHTHTHTHTQRIKKNRTFHFRTEI